MSKYIKVKGNIIEKKGGTSRVYAKAGIEHNSNGFIDYFAKNYTYGNPQKPPVKIMDGAIKEIELLTALDQGSANDKSGNYQAGMIFGKSYHFKVKSYVKNPPVNITDIKWMIKYHSLSQNKWLEIPLSAKGDSVTITMKDEDMCGRFVYVRGYVHEPEAEGEYKQWKHNRFRWFDRKQIKEEVSDRLINSSLIDQGQSSMCGIAVVGFNFAKEHGDAYTKFILELHQKGIAKNILTDFTLAIDDDEHLLKYKPTSSEYPTDSYSIKKMALADFIFLICIKDSLNDIFDYDPDGQNAGGMIEGGTGLTLPREIASIMKNIANYQDVINDTNLITSRSRGASIWTKKLLNKLNQGYKIGILIDSDNFTKNKKSIFTIPTHWVGLINIYPNDALQLVSLEVYTWGGTRTWTVTYDVFKDGFFGYVGGK